MSYYLSGWFLRNESSLRRVLRRKFRGGVRVEVSKKTLIGYLKLATRFHSCVLHLARWVELPGLRSKNSRWSWPKPGEKAFLLLKHAKAFVWVVWVYPVIMHTYMWRIASAFCTTHGPCDGKIMEMEPCDIDTQGVITANSMCPILTRGFWSQPDMLTRSRACNTAILLIFSVTKMLTWDNTKTAHEISQQLWRDTFTTHCLGPQGINPNAQLISTVRWSNKHMNQYTNLAIQSCLIWSHGYRVTQRAHHLAKHIGFVSCFNPAISKATWWMMHQA